MSHYYPIYLHITTCAPFSICPDPRKRNDLSQIIPACFLSVHPNRTLRQSVNLRICCNFSMVRKKVMVCFNSFFHWLPQVPINSSSPLPSSLLPFNGMFGWLPITPRTPSTNYLSSVAAIYRFTGSWVIAETALSRVSAGTHGEKRCSRISWRLDLAQI